ncbi:MAG: elongation factor Ts [Bacilli bacterium]|nr:elongation factor Ts [Bacilli bacterium]
MIKASDVKELREKTGAGMMDCKKALEAVSGDMEKAVDWLREKGITKAEKKASRVAAEGLASVKVDGNKAVIVEVNCETDFVASNEKFTSFIDDLSTVILNNKVETLDEVMELKMGNDSVKDTIINLTAQIGEKISFRRFEKVEKADNEVFGSYLHLGGKIGSLVVLKGADEVTAKEVAMQDAAMAPVAVTREEVPEDMVNREKEVIKEQIKNDEKNKNKPEDIIEKMATGRLNKFYKEVCLTEQEYIKDSSMTVGDFVKNNNGEIVKAIRYQVGEGIEKKEEDFASEVMSQINDAK